MRVETKLATVVVDLGPALRRRLYFYLVVVLWEKRLVWRKRVIKNRAKTHEHNTCNNGCKKHKEKNIHTKEEKYTPSDFRCPLYHRWL